jgi:uncharacterized membrane protein
MSTHVQDSITINQPVELVFTYLTDSRNITKWQPALLEARADPEGPAQVGTRVTDVRTFLGRKMESVYEITAVEPNKRMSLKSVSGPFPYQGDFLFEPEGTAATKLTFIADFEPKGFFKLAEGMLAGTLKKEVEAQLAAAKQVLESEK